MKIKVKLLSTGVIEAHEWNADEAYEETEGWEIVDVDGGAEIFPYVSRLVEKDGKLTVDNSGEMVDEGKAALSKMEADKEKHDLIESYKKELSDTDYVVTKIAEAQALGEDVPSLLDKYSEILKRRKELRNKINHLE